MLKQIKNTLTALALSTAIYTSGCGSQGSALGRFMGQPDTRLQNPENVYLEVTSDPGYASVYGEDNQKVGECPQHIVYPVTSEEVAAGFKTINIKARWISGARIEDSLNLKLRQVSKSEDFYLGLRFEYNFSRPEKAPGLKDDLSYAMDRERLDIEKSKASAAYYSSLAAERAAKDQESANNRKAFNDWMDQTRKANEYYESQGWGKK